MIYAVMVICVLFIIGNALHLRTLYKEANFSTSGEIVWRFEAPSSILCIIIAVMMLVGLTYELYNA